MLPQPFRLQGPSEQASLLLCPLPVFVPPIPVASSRVQLQPGVANDEELAGDQNTHQGEYF